MGDLHRIENKIDKLDGKVDKLIASEAKNSEAIIWLRGHAKIITLLAVSALGWLAAEFLTGVH
jgi:hypothetical protein